MNLSKLSVKELEELCENGALPTAGTKAELIARLRRNPHRLPEPEDVGEEKEEEVAEEE